MMRIAIVSDIHGNRAAFDAVLADLRETSPDLILHGGDLVHGGSDDAGIVDQIRDLGWPGVLGNTDELMFRPDSIANINNPPAFIAAIAEFARESLGNERIAWLSRLPLVELHDSFALVHATRHSCWPVPQDRDLLSLGKPLAVYAHIHRPFIRPIGDSVICNTGSVSLSLDGDPRASYLLIDDSGNDNGVPQIRRVVYDVEAEIAGIRANKVPHAASIASMLRSAGSSSVTTSPEKYLQPLHHKPSFPPPNLPREW